MNFAKLRLALIAALFLGWISWLSYLALPSTTSRDVLSRPQFLASTLDVIGQVEAPSADRPSPRVVVQEVHWPSSSANLGGQTLTVVNLEDCIGWSGPGAYILPLIPAGNGYYRVVGIPRSPGVGGLTYHTPRIYPATEQNLRQLDAVPKPKSGEK